MSLTLIWLEPNSENSACSSQDCRIHLHHKVDLIFDLSHLVLVLTSSVALTHALDVILSLALAVVAKKFLL